MILGLFTVEVDPCNLKPLREAFKYNLSQRAQHALDIFNTSGNFKNHVINTSQHIDRMTPGQGGKMPCVTPHGECWSMPLRRYITGLGFGANDATNNLGSKVSYPNSETFQAWRSFFYKRSLYTGSMSAICPAQPLWLQIVIALRPIVVKWSWPLCFRNCMSWLATHTIAKQLGQLTFVPLLPVILKSSMRQCNSFTLEDRPTHAIY